MSNKAHTDALTAADLVEALPDLVSQRRAVRGLSLRACAAEIGIPWSLVHRIEHGHTANTSTIVAILHWLGDPGPGTSA